MMSRLFSKSEIYALKNSIKKQKNIYTYCTEGDIDNKKIKELNNLYGFALGLERDVNKGTQEKILE